MAYDEELADRLRDQLALEGDAVEKKMFGGLAFLIDGNLAVSASSQGGLLLRVDPKDTDALTSQPHAERFVMRGREMNGWLRVGPEALDTDEALARWVGIGVSYARSMPPK
ncbi:MAG: hypothetical protein JWN95_2329 [Frankiales bacterium]|nr:hypothetical protein [Frankiales bacterium]